MEMKHYKEELRRFSLSKEDKQTLLHGLMQEEKCTCSYHRYRYAVLPVLCVCVLVLLLVPKAQDEPAAAVYKPKFAYEQVYEPDHYVPIAGAASGVADPVSNMQEFLDLNQEHLHSVYDTYDAKQALPVYRYERIYDMKKGFPRYADAYYRQRIFEVASMLGVDGGLQEGTWRDVYVIENDTIRITIRDSGDIALLGKDMQFDTLEVSSNEILTSAKDYYEKFKAVLPIQVPSFRIEASQANYKVQILEYENADYVYFDENTYAQFSIVMDYIGAESELIYRPELVIYQRSHEMQLGEYTIISPREAQQSLLQGRYIAYALPAISITARDVVGWELCYSDDAYENFLPYRIPLYSFYVIKNGNLYRMDVPALQVEEMKKLDGFDKKWQ